MNNKNVISLAALVAVMAVAIAPTAAQALEGPEGNKSPVHWQFNGKEKPKGERTPVIAWGTLKLESTAGTIQCKNSEYIEDTNTTAGKAVSEVVAFTSFGCKAMGGEFCVPPEEERSTGVNLTPDASPDTGVWPSGIVEEGLVDAAEAFRSYDMSGAGGNPIKLNVECYATNGEKVANLLFHTGAVPGEGSSTPLITNGTSATKPSEISFEDLKKETGHLMAATEIESPKEEIMEPAVKVEAGMPILKDEGTPMWAPIIKPGCRVKANNLFRNDLVKNPILSPTVLQLENKVNPGKENGLLTIVEPVKFNCGPLIPSAAEGTTKGKLKFVGYLDNGTTPLITIATSLGA
jgi:hypothetical protein